MQRPTEPLPCHLRLARRGLAPIVAATLIACAQDAPTSPVIGTTALRPAGALALGAARPLPMPPSCAYAVATDINERGTVVGTTFLCPEARQRAIVWNAAGEWSFLPEVEGLPLQPFHVTDGGAILATTYQRETDLTRYYELSPDGRLRDISPHVDGSASVGHVSASSGLMLLSVTQGTGPFRQVLWNWHSGATTLVPFPETGELILTDVSDRGEAVGTIRTGDAAYQAVTWRASQGFRALAIPQGALWSSGMRLDDRGRVFGSTEWPIPETCTGFGGSTVGRATVWTSADAPRLVEGEAFACASAPDFRDVNAQGIAVGVLQYRADRPMIRAFAVTADGATAVAPCEIDGVPASEGCQAVAINQRGVVLGLYVSEAGVRPVLWEVTGG